MNFKSKLVNIRPLFIVFLAVVLGILNTFYLMCSYFLNTYNFGFLIIIFISAALLTLLCAFVYFKKKNKENYITVNSKKILTFAIAFFVAIIFSVFSFNSYFSNREYSGKQVIVGEIISFEEYAGYSTTKLDNVSIIENGKQTKLQSGVNVLVSGFVELERNTILTIYAEIAISPYYKNVKDIGYFTAGFGYNVECTNHDILVKTNNNLDDVVKGKVKEILDKNLSEENSNLALSVLFGERVDLSDHIKTSFSYTGISHILAVSGLNVAVIILCIHFLLKLCKINNYANIVIIALFVLFYCYLCNFTASVLRAGVMGLIMVGCDCFGKRYDSLNALSFAGVLILLLDPKSLFSVGFQLSFLCVFSLICLAYDIQKMLLKIKLPNFLASALAVSIAANLVIIPILANVFKQISLISIFANILVVPLFSVAYVLIFFAVIFTYLFDFFGILLKLPEFILHTVKTFAGHLASIPYAYITVFRAGAIALILIILFCLILKYTMLSKKYKRLLAVATLITFSAVLLINSIPNKIVDSYVAVTFQYSSNHVYFFDQKEHISVIGAPDKKDLNYSLIANKYNSVKNIFAYDFSLNNYDDFLDTVKTYQVENVYLPCEYSHYSYSFYKLNAITNVYFISDFKLGEFYMSQIIDDAGATIGVKMFNDNLNILIVNSTQNINNAKAIGRSIDRDVDYLIANRVKHNLKQHTEYRILNIVYHRENIMENAQTINLYDSTSFTKNF